MSTTTVAAAAAVARLTPTDRSFYRWLHRWHAKAVQDGRVLNPSTGYLARKQKVSEPTIYRRLARLRAAGWIACTQTPGIERVITPLVDVVLASRTAPPIATHADRGDERGLRGVRDRGPTLSVSDAGNASTQQQTKPAPVRPFPALLPGVVADLVQAGVARPVAERLLREKGEGPCRRQLDALSRRKATNPAAVLVAAIRDDWTVPEAVPPRVAKPVAPPRAFVPSADELAMYYRGMAR
jgi:hypothetical protein